VAGAISISLLRFGVAIALGRIIILGMVVGF
jgi:hypothetical protein